MKAKHLLKAVCLLVLTLPSHAQQIVCEQLLATPGLDVLWPTACGTPNGEFVVTGAARPTGSATPSLATHTFVARIQANGCDTLWTRRLTHSVAYYTSSAVRADARGIWLLTPDTVLSSNLSAPFKGVRLWRLNAAGRMRRIVRVPPSNAREFSDYLLPAADGGGYAQLYTQLPLPGSPRAAVMLRFDSTGVVRWRRDYGYVANYYGGNLCYTPTGHVLLTGMVGVGANYDAHAKLLEVETNRGDSLRGATLPWGPNVIEEVVASRNGQPVEAIALKGGGYVLPSLVNPTLYTQTGQLTRLDANYNVLWRYQLPTLPTPNAYNVFQQVRELADGTLLALVGSRDMQRTFWLYRFQASTGTLLANYAFTPTTPTIVVGVSQLLPVSSDSTLLVVGSSRPFSNTNLVGPIYVARLRVPGLPRVVAPAQPLATRAGALASLAIGLYPNPAREGVTVDLPARAGAGHLELRDGLGRLVRWQAVGAAPQAVRWSLVGLAPGLYAVVLHGPGGAGVRRLVVE